MRRQLLLLLASSVVLSAASGPAWGQQALRDGSQQSSAQNLREFDETIATYGDFRTETLPQNSRQRTQQLTFMLSDLDSINDDQKGCPVQVLSASFTRPGAIVLTSVQEQDQAPTLHLGFQNLSGKEITAVELTGWIKVKDDPYQLDSVTRPFHLELSRGPSPASSFKSTQVLKLASNAIGLDRIELAEILYADGSTWQPERRHCVFHSPAVTQRAEIQ